MRAFPFLVATAFLMAIAADARYKFGLGYAELHKFGDVMIGRECTTNRTFAVRH